MRVHIEHWFPGGSRSDLERLYMLDDEFNRHTFERMGYARKVIERKLLGGVLTRSLHLCPKQPLPAPFSSLAPAGLFYISEHISYDFVRHQGTWRTVPSVLGKQFQAGGTIQLVARPGGCAFLLEGEVKASLLLLSRSAEKQAVQTAEQQHAQLAQAVRERLELTRSSAFTHAARMVH